MPGRKRAGNAEAGQARKEHQQPRLTGETGNRKQNNFKRTDPARPEGAPLGLSGPSWKSFLPISGPYEEPRFPLPSQVHRPCPPRTPRSLTADGGEECTMAKPLRPPAPRIDSTTGAYPRDRSRVQESFHSKVRKCIASHRDGKPSKTPVGLALPRTLNFISD